MTTLDKAGLALADEMRAMADAVLNAVGVSDDDPTLALLNATEAYAAWRARGEDEALPELTDSQRAEIERLTRGRDERPTHREILDKDRDMDLLSRQVKAARAENEHLRHEQDEAEREIAEVRKEISALRKAVIDAAMDSLENEGSF